MKLFFLRHGEAEAGAGPDAARSLTAEGRRQAQRLAVKLREIGVCFDLMWSSPLKRALETATILLESGVAQKVEVSDLLLPSTDPAILAAFLAQLSQAPSERGLVGHEPLFSKTMEMLIFGAHQGGLVLKKAGVGVVERDSSGSWRLLALLSQTWL